jgi:hypothetical protein
MGMVAGGWRQGDMRRIGCVAVLTAAQRDAETKEWPPASNNSMAPKMVRRGACGGVVGRILETGKE